MRSVGDFRLLPEGGCKELCRERMDCGHVCEYYCHNFEHERKYCNKKCEIILPCDHKCTKKCNEECGKCRTMVMRDLPCKHSNNYECYLDINKIECRALVEDYHPKCGH